MMKKKSCADKTRGEKNQTSSEGDRLTIPEGSDAVLFERKKPWHLHGGFEPSSGGGLREGENGRKKGEKKELGSLWSLGFSVGGLGSTVRIILCYYEPSPHHVQAMKCISCVDAAHFRLPAHAF